MGKSLLWVCRTNKSIGVCSSKVAQYSFSADAPFQQIGGREMLSGITVCLQQQGYVRSGTAANNIEG